MRAPAAAWATPSPNVQLIARRTPPCRWPKTDPSMGQCTDFHLARIRVPRGGASESPLAVSHQSRGKTCLSEASCSDFNAISTSQTAQKKLPSCPGSRFLPLLPTEPHKGPKIPVSLHTSTGLFRIPPPRDRHQRPQVVAPGRLPSQEPAKNSFSGRAPGLSQPPATDSQSLSYAPIIFPSENSEAARSRFSRPSCSAPRRSSINVTSFLTKVSVSP
jgi:hypothetical protein